MFGKIYDVIVLGYRLCCKTKQLINICSPTHFSPVETDGEECEDIQGDAEQSYKVVDFAQNCSEYPHSETSQISEIQ